MNRKNLEILKPITIKSMTLRNRLANAPFGSIPAADGKGYINDTSIENCRTLIESNIGLLMMGPARAIPTPSKFYGSQGEESKKPVGMASIEDDSYIESWKKLVDFAHSHGVKLGLQLGEWGPQGLNYMSDLIDDNKKYKFFSLNKEETLPDMHIMTLEELNNIVEYVAQAARRAKEAGIDCVELHSAHSTGLLYANALDPFFNNRDDEFGGDLDRRLALHVRTIKRMRELVGEDYPIFIRINADDMKGQLGHTIDDVCKYIIPRLEAAGFDCIDLSAGGPMYTMQGPLPPMYYPRGFMMHYAKAVKQVTKLPVIGVGRITTVEMAEKYLQDNCCDIVYMGRQIFADKNTLSNFLEGRDERKSTRGCIACLKPGCIDCTVNYERYGTLNPGFIRPNLNKVAEPKKILIIGGGVAGMEAARIAAIKGHNVTLWEKEGVLGGTVATLATTPLTSEFQNIIDYQIGQLSELNVNVRCCYEATLERVKAFAPDVCILATGADMLLPDSVKDGMMVMTHLDAMKRKREFRSMSQWRKKVVIYGFTAAEFAIDLAEAGADVTLMGAGGDFAIGSESYMTRERKFFLRRKLTDINYIRSSEETRRVYNPNVIFHAKLEGVSREGVHYYHHGIHKTMPYDVLIISGGKKKNDEMFEALQEFVPAVYKIGDCNKIANITQAINQANELVRNL